MVQERLKSVMVLYIHKERSDGLDLENTCKEFISKSDYTKTKVFFLVVL